MKDLLTLIYGKKLKPKFQVNDLVRTAYLKKSQKEIQLIGFLNVIKFQKNLMVQDQLITLMIYQSVIMNPC